MIIDSHIHVGPMARQYVRSYSLSTLLERMDRLDIAIAISTNTFSLDEVDLEYGAALGDRLCCESHGRILSYHYYDPRRMQQSLSVMERYLDHPAYVGIKLHPSWTMTAADDERYRPAWEFAAYHKLPILSHTWDCSPTNPKQAYAFPSRFEKFVSAYPEVHFIIAHSGGRRNGIQAAVALGRKYRNVLFDIAGDIWPNGFLEYVAAEAGADRILFGSDYTMMDQQIMLGVVMGAEIPIEDKEKILYQNAQRVFHLSHTCIGG